MYLICILLFFSRKFKPRASFWHRFQWNSSTGAISTAFWNLLPKSRIFDDFAREMKKSLPVSDISVCQMKVLGLFFRNFLEFWIFVIFCRFYRHLNIAYIRIFRNLAQNAWKSGKSENWIYVFSCNFWSIADIKKVKQPFLRDRNGGKIWPKKFEKFNLIIFH